MVIQRAPERHGDTHRHGAEDTVKLDDLGTPDDNTDLDASSSRHGLLPKLSGTTTTFLRGDGTWTSAASTPYVDTTAVGNVGTGVDTLITYDLPANTLSTDGKGVRITVWGSIANNANAKTLRLWFGTANIISYDFPTNATDRWRIVALVFRTATDAQDCDAQLVSITEQDHEFSAETQDDGAAITIKCTGEATSNNDIVQEGLLVEVL